MAEEKNQKPASTPEQPDLEAHSDDNKTENNETTQKITRYKKQAARSFVLAFTTLIAIIAVCIAWFVSNTKVTMTGTSISAENTVPFELASAGDRQEPEPTKMPGKLSEGNEKSYTTYIDYKTGKTQNFLSDGTAKTLYVGTSSLAWHLSGQQNFHPGASGELEFYFIPKQSGLKTITLQLNLVGAKDDTNGNFIKLEGDTEDNVLKNLINGHILMFENWSADVGYSNWLGTDKKLIINAPTENENDDSVFQKNQPYKVTIYWKWPKYFRNFVYNERFEGDLFFIQNDAYSNLLNFVNEQVPVAKDSCGAKNTSNTFYSAEKYDDNIIKARGNIKASDNMTDAMLESCIKYYDLADEYIGNNAQYIYVELNVEQ